MTPATVRADAVSPQTIPANDELASFSTEECREVCRIIGAMMMNSTNHAKERPRSQQRCTLVSGVSSRHWGSRLATRDSRFIGHDMRAADAIFRSQAAASCQCSVALRASAIATLAMTGSHSRRRSCRNCLRVEYQGESSPVSSHRQHVSYRFNNQVGLPSAPLQTHNDPSVRSAPQPFGGELRETPARW